MTNNLKTLQEKFASYCLPPAHENIALIKKISMVGALPDPKSFMSENDLRYLGTTFSQLKTQGIPVSPDFEIDIINIHPDAGGRDFHTETAQTDLAIFCMVFNPPQARKTDFDTDLDLRGIFAISQNHHNKDIWYESAVRVGAKILSVFGGPHTEINAGHFLPCIREPQFSTISYSDAGCESLEATLLKHTSYDLPSKVKRQPAAMPPYPGQ